MKTMPVIKSARFTLLAVILTAFLALAFSPGPASAGVGFMKRSGEKNSSSSDKSDKSDKASSAPSKSVERSAPAQSSQSGGFGSRNSPSSPSSSSSGFKPGRGGSDSGRSWSNRSEDNTNRNSNNNPNPASQGSGIDYGSVSRRGRVDRQDNRDNSGTVYRTPTDNTVRRDGPAPQTPEVRSGDERGKLGTIFGRGKRGTTEQRDTVRQPSDEGHKRPSGGDHGRVEAPARTDNRPQRAEHNTGRTTGGGTHSWSRNPNKTIERTYETRRDWQTRYRNYDHKWRPQYSGGYYHYRGHSGLDPYYYGHYCFSYAPRYTYPSIYFHYGAFPYIYSDRVVVITRPVRHYTYVTLGLHDIFHDDYYLSQRAYYPYNGYNFSSSIRSSLRDALNDIEKAWEEPDNDRLMRHVARGSKIDVFSKGSYSYSVEVDDYKDMTRDAMSTIDTVDFEFTDVKLRAPDQAVAYANHNYYTYGNDYATVYTSYAFARDHGNWYITEIDSSPDRFGD